MSEPIKKLTIEGFKSIRKLDGFAPRSLNVLIGANGAGKSNFIGFFRLLHELVEQRLQVAVALEGGADACLHMGPKVTPRIFAKVYFGRNGYEFSLVPAAGRMIFADEATIFAGDRATVREPLGSGHSEAKLKELKDQPGKSGAKHGVPHYVYEAISSWVVYHFHDTSPSAGLRRPGPINVNEFLRPNGENLAAFLYRVHQTDPESYRRIRDVVRLAAPFFDDFKLRPMPANTELIQLEWLQRDSDYPLIASQLSDGTLRFICLATALLQRSLPPTVFFDEPELGLHPYALTLLASLFQQAAKQYGSYVSKQLIVSTQSVPLLSEFAPEDVIVVERKNGETIFEQLESGPLEGWLQEYSLGELWQKNVLRGRPRIDQAAQPSGVTSGSTDGESNS